MDDATPMAVRPNRDLGIYFSDTGSGQPVLLLHGVGGSADDWIAAERHLKNRFRTVRLDARGHGRSAIPDGKWRLDDFTSDVARVLDDLGIDRAHVAGYSMGALIAQAFTLRFPERVDKLALLASTVGRNGAEQEAVESRLAFIRSFPPREYFDRHACKRWFTDEFVSEAPEVIEAYREAISRNDPIGYAKAYQVLAENDLADRLPEITSRTLVMTAANDIGAGPKTAVFIAERIKNAHLIILPRLRHQILLEAPDIVGGILREFFSDQPDLS